MIKGLHRPYPLNLVKRILKTFLFQGKNKVK